jgi:CHASE3 domain sensor protein
MSFNRAEYYRKYREEHADHYRELTKQRHKSIKDDPQKAENEKLRAKYRRKLNILKENIENLRDSDEEDYVQLFTTLTKKILKCVTGISEIEKALENNELPKHLINEAREICDNGKHELRRMLE